MYKSLEPFANCFQDCFQQDTSPAFIMPSPKQPVSSTDPPLEDISIGEPINITQALAQSITAAGGSTPVELSNLSQYQAPSTNEKASEPQQAPSSPQSAPSLSQPTILNDQDNIAAPSHRTSSVEAGPSSAAPHPTEDNPISATADAAPDPSSTVHITLLLLSGARHPFKIDARYLNRRNVNVEANNPLNLTIYNVKELIWRDWRDEWEPRPESPAMIRLIHVGHMPDDKMKLAGKILLRGSQHCLLY